MSALLVGLSGVTNGGKSTLSNKLLKVLPHGTKLIKQDNYFRPIDSPLHVPCPGGINHYNNWDVISSIDMDQLFEDLELMRSEMKVKWNQVHHIPIPYSVCDDLDFAANIDGASITKVVSPLYNREHRGIILIDGFTIYDDQRFVDACDLKFFLTLPKEPCFTRRHTHYYDPPDPPGYFDACVWPMYEQHLGRVKELSDIHFYDGTLNFEHIFISVLKKIVEESIL